MVASHRSRGHGRREGTRPAVQSVGRGHRHDVVHGDGGLDGPTPARVRWRPSIVRLWRPGPPARAGPWWPSGRVAPATGWWSPSPSNRRAVACAPRPSELAPPASNRRRGAPAPVSGVRAKHA